MATPFGGTKLAGVAALRLQVLGAECGANAGLTESGSARWLPHVPSWARAQVWTHTVSAHSQTWAFDYCHAATDVLLREPGDGFAEARSMRLSGGRGNTDHVGACCGPSMPQPAALCAHALVMDLLSSAPTPRPDDAA